MDPELRPIEGAVVRIIDRHNLTDQGLVLSTNLTGEFAARGLRASEYVVYVAKAGYHDPAPHLVKLPEATTERVQIELEPILKPVAHHTSRNYQVKFIEQACLLHPAGATLANPWCITGYQPANTSLKYDFDPLKQGRLETFLVEMKWTPTIAQCGGGMRSDVYSPEQNPVPGPGYADVPAKGPSNPYHWDNVPESARSPTRLVIPRNGTDPAAMHSKERTELNGGRPIKLEGAWAVTVYSYPVGALGTPVDYSCAYDQTVAVWLSHFYEVGAPDGWSVFTA